MSDGTVLENTADSEEGFYDLIGIRNINIFVHWIHEFALAISAIAITFSVLIAGADEVVGGLIKAQWPWILVVWGFTQIIGTETLNYGSWKRVVIAFKTRNWWALAGWATLGLAFVFVTVQIMAIYTIENVMHISEEAAISQIGLTVQAWGLERAILMGGLPAVAAIAAWVTRPKTKPDHGERVESIKREIELIPLLQERDALAQQRSLAGLVGKVQTGKAVVGEALRRQPKDQPDAGQSYISLTPLDPDDFDPDPAPPRGPRGPRTRRADAGRPSHVLGTLRGQRVSVAKDIYNAVDRGERAEPSVRELMDALGVKSTATAQSIKLQALDELAAERHRHARPAQLAAVANG